MSSIFLHGDIAYRWAGAVTGLDSPARCALSTVLRLAFEAVGPLVVLLLFGFYDYLWDFATGALVVTSCECLSDSGSNGC